MLLLIGGCTILFLNVFMLLSTRSSIAETIDELSDADAVIILGAGVYGNGDLTPILKDRVDTAVLVYQAGRAKKILVSGDNGSLAYNEVVPIWEYLRAANIPEEDIFLDYAGFDTYDTMYRARVVFEVGSAIVVTQSFHLPRAVFLAHALGIKIQGISPSKDKGTFFNSLREIPARIKAVGDVVLKSTPTYLGERIPISGDGRATLSE